MNYIIETAGQAVTVEAVSEKHAIMKAIVNQKFTTLGFLISVEIEGNTNEEEVSYYDPVKCLVDVGFEVEEKEKI